MNARHPPPGDGDKVVQDKSISSSLSTGQEVLVVEDEVRVRDMLSRALKEMGFHSTLTPTAEAAV
jgi:ActR/RegA family two-component response regulator